MPAGHDKLDPTVSVKAQCSTIPGSGRRPVSENVPGGRVWGGGGSASKSGDEIVDYEALIPPLQARYLAWGGVPPELPVALLAEPCHQPSARIRKENAYQRTT